MRSIKVDEIADGMILAKEVVDFYGHVILNPGFVLSPAWISRLKNRKIESVSIEEQEAEDKKADFSRSAKLRVAAEISDRVDKMFSLVGHDARMQELAKAVKLHMLKQKLGKT